jgi:hypothetical protein
MPLSRTIAGTFREFWQQTTPQVGGTSQTVPTNIVCNTANLPRVKVKLTVDDVAGLPQMSATPSISNGKIHVTVSNTGTIVDTATWSLEVLRVHSIQHAPGVSPYLFAPADLSFGLQVANSFWSAISLSRSMKVVTPEMFGAVGTGLVDDTTPIVAALAYLAAQGGGVLYCAGRYLISSAITVPSGVTIRGCATSLPLQGGFLPASPMAGPSTFLSAQAAFSFFIMSNRTALDCLAFDSTTDAPVLTSGAVIDCSGADGVSLSHIYINRAYNGIVAAYPSHYFAGISAADIRICHYKAAGVRLSHAVGIYLTDFAFVDPTYGATSVGIYILQSTATLMATNGTIWGGNRSVLIAGGAIGSMDTIADDIHFENVDFDSAANTGFEASNLANSSLSNCWIGASGANGLALTGDGQAFTVENCSVLMNATSGLVLYSTTFRGVRFSGNHVMANNRSNGALTAGIFILDGAKHFILDHNECTNVCPYAPIGPGHQKYGILIGGAANAADYYVIRGNLLDGNDTAGLLDNGTGVNKDVGGNPGA